MLTVEEDQVNYIIQRWVSHNLAMVIRTIDRVILRFEKMFFCSDKLITNAKSRQN